jgi:transcriptional regulator with XRE-family HTH domain
MTARDAGGIDLGDTVPQSGSVGVLLQFWRKSRRLSQLALASEAGVSPRHLCFLETGRAKPSRDMVLLLAEALDVPLRERNTLLLAAGLAPEYTESRLDAPSLEVVRRALDAILEQHEPFPAVVMDRHWEIVRTNRAAAGLFGFLLEGQPLTAATNVLRLMFDPSGVRPFVANWEAVAESLARRVHREAVGGVKDAATERLLAEIRAYPGVPAVWRRAASALGSPLLPVVPVNFEKDTRAYRFFSTVTTLGTPQDITVQEIRIECFFPADERTRERARLELARPA